MSSTHWGSRAITDWKRSATWEPGPGILRLASLRDDPGEVAEILAVVIRVRAPVGRSELQLLEANPA